VTTAATTPADDASINLSHVTRRFGRSVAVDDLSLIVPSGTTCGFLGLNGAGKSTTLRMAVGLLAPTSGTLRVAGCDVPADRQALKFKLGYVPDRPTVYPWMTVSQAIDFCRTLYGPAWQFPAVAAMAKTLRLDLTKRVKHLSKGAAAKVSLLLAMGHDPAVLVLDEPTGGFDPLAHDEFLEGLLSTAISNGDRPPRTILFSSHTLPDVQRLADTVAILHRGRLLLHKPLDHLLATTKRLRVVLETESAPSVAPPGTVYQVRRGREWTVTVADFMPDTVGIVRDRNGGLPVEVIDLTLDDVFRDHVRAADPAGGPTGSEAR
jgi:ABC-2 type transport system ATP-binding protein